MKIDRHYHLQEITFGFRNHAVVVVLGPRQCGKTTLARQLIQQDPDFNPINYFDLDDPTHLLMLSDPKLTLSQRKGLIVIDEIQKIPDLFPIIRVFADEERQEHRFLILGSASHELIRQSSQSLAGRIHFCELTPFEYAEVAHINTLWLRGGYPRSYLALSDLDSWDWRQHYIKTFLEQDIPNLGLQIPAHALRRFWMMLSHYHGQTFNSSEIARSLGISDTTARRYLDLLVGTFMVRQLAPWYENIQKRQVKQPKIYFRDSGILFFLLGIQNHEQLLVHPKLGACWEGFALEEIIRAHNAKSEECYFWGVHQQAELDLLIIQNGKRIGFEIKYTSKPILTKSMKMAAEILKLDELYLIFAGQEQFPLGLNVQAIGLQPYLNSQKQYRE